ncbi:hypothetical protein [Lacimicrobium sp. SS2-24]|uniref:hypothetical protein n=1 Tax=Lacimicrobium sp. SS2-24 TaxID=2005569 RepID=UPI000B4AEFEA|nr:hypothetical protein [Lacimicrobium sp. SS2-24]
MTKGNIYITVSGGAGTFGNISQGDHNQLSTTMQEAVQQFHHNLDELKHAQLATAEQVENLKQDVEALLQRPQQQGMLEKAKALYETYSWAIDPLRKLFSVMCP